MKPGGCMNCLFIHQNFPGQFKFLAPALVGRGHRVAALTTARRDRTLPAQWRGIELHAYEVSRGNAPGVHPWVADLETKTLRGEACLQAAIRMRADGFRPDVVIAHPGWGESLFIKDVWPDARLGIYSEFYYLEEGSDANFDPEFAQTDERERCRLRLKNLNNLLHFEVADAGLSPTRWQASVFPERFRSRITVAHDGIDTRTLVPDPQVRMVLNNRIVLARTDELITFVNRNLEPYRGFHVFMRALPDLLQRRPRARVIIVGGDDVSYGARPAQGKSWRHVLRQEVSDRISQEDWRRVHFLGRVPYGTFVKLLQLSTVHVYLTYPFVLSWSLLEAMSIGCAVVASDTAPVREVMAHGETGRLVNFFDRPALVDEVCELLDNQPVRQSLGAAARAFVRQHYDLHEVCLPAQLAWVERLGGT